jgi:hypothetical protein
MYRAVANINMDTCVAGPILVAKASPVLKVLLYSGGQGQSCIKGTVYSGGQG